MENKEVSTQEDQLVTMHKNARKRKKRKLFITLAVVFIAVITVIVTAVLVLRSKVRSQFASTDASEVQSAEVTIGNIRTTVSGSGTLSANDLEEILLPDSVQVTDYYVAVGDHVENGQLIATVTNASLMSAMSDIQEELDALDEKIADASGDTVSSAITAGAAGRIKAVYAEKGEDVVSVMYEHGALILLSLDGYMMTEISSDSLSAGDTVEVTLSNGSTVDGLVEKQKDGIATILLTDNGTVYQDTVTVKDGDGTELGAGILDIHNSMSIVGYAGTISAVKVSENDKVAVGGTLLTLTDTETSANYDSLLKEREELEEQLNQMIKVYKEGGICAAASGTVDALADMDTTSTGTINGGQSVSETTVVAAISPDTTMAITISVDETDILSLEAGQEASVTIDSIGEETYRGTVTEVNTTASSSSGVTSYSAVISIEKTEQMLSGMSASVVITIQGSDDALLIPVEAIHQTSSEAYVYTEYDEDSGEFSGMKEVTVGLSNSTYVEITEGLEEGDTVYYTTVQDNGFGGMDFGNIGNGDMPDMGNMPDMGSMPDMGDMPEGSGKSFDGGKGFGGSGNGDERPSGGNMPGGSK